MDKHGLVCALKDLKLQLGRTPNRDEFVSKIKNGRRIVDAEFGGYASLLKAAGLIEDIPGESDRIEAKFKKKYSAIVSKKEQIQGFFRHVIDLDDLFERAGNPQVLKALVQPDTHAKYADAGALSCFMSFAKYYKPDVHIILGDYVDCEGLSHWPADELSPRRIVPELKLARELLGRIVAATPYCTTRIYLEGNHEAWITQALNNMPELFDGLADLDIEINLKTLLGLSKFGYELFPLNHLIKVGKAHFTHGIYTGSAHAKKHLSVFKANIYYGHLHDMQAHQETGMDGPTEAASLGCLARLDARFLKGKPNNWSHGLGTFEFFRDGNYTRNIMQMINGRMAYNGLIFS